MATLLPKFHLHCPSLHLLGIRWEVSSRSQPNPGFCTFQLAPLFFSLTSHLGLWRHSLLRPSRRNWAPCCIFRIIILTNIIIILTTTMEASHQMISWTSVDTFSSMRCLHQDKSTKVFPISSLLPRLPLLAKSKDFPFLLFVSFKSSPDYLTHMDVSE